ncbi:MAG: pantetheine-phosphate adenylyltransferase [Lentisphaerae bacterium]|nr:pantetheine-phosphate adenylyltransferase [Lentisphaerota bacterium]
MTDLAIYAGTFDPMTLGHLDLIERGAEIFDRLILAVAAAPPKDNLFSAEERMAMAREVVAGMDNVTVEAFDGLLVEFARRKGARVLIRGLRAYSDFEFEFQMALTNRKLAPEIETLFMMPKESHSYVSSSTVREVALFGGETGEFVPEPVERMLRRKFGHAH